MQNPSVIRAYDIRGVYGETLFDKDFYHIARRFVEVLREIYPLKTNFKIAVARDIRASSPQCHAMLVKGLTQAGAEVSDIGIAASPLLYFAVYNHNFDAGIVVTASHNPKQYNGAKFIVKGYNFVTKDILGIAKPLLSNEVLSGSVASFAEPHQSYEQRLIANTTNLINNARIVWDCGGGALCKTVKSFASKIPGEHFFVSADFDPEFKDRDLDPSNIKNLTKLLASMRQNNADIGFAFDGDGDRIGVVTKQGELLKGEDLTCFLASVILPQSQCKKVIVDIKCSPLKKQRLEDLGAEVLLCKTGHCLIKEQIKIHNAPLAGESSGHIFIAHNYYGFDDALYTASIVLQNFEGFKAFAAKICNYPFSSAINIPCPEDKKDAVIANLKTKLKAIYGSINETDGIRLESEDFWFLIRRSNTEPILNFIIEGNKDISQIKEQILQMVNLD